MDRSLEARVRKQGWIARHSRSFPLFIFGLSIAVVIASVAAAESAEQNAIKQTLATQAAELKMSILRQDATYSAVLHVSTLYLSKVDVTQNEFEEFARSASLAADHKTARGVGWGKVSRDPQSHAIASVVVKYLSPMNNANRRAMGYDMYSDERRRNAIYTAATTGQPTATAPVVLIQDAGTRKPGFLVYKPVPDALNVPKGFVYVAFNGEVFLRRLLDKLPHHPDYAAIYDGGVSSGDLIGKTGRLRANYYVASEKLRFANRNWTLVIGQAAPSMFARSTLWLLLFGLIVSALLLSLTHLIVRSALHDRTSFEWQSRQLQIRNTLNRELNHRVKNTLANVLSIMSLTRRNSDNIDDFVRGLTGRVRALSATHSVLTQTEWTNANIRDIFEAELAPYLGGTSPTISLKGNDINLEPYTALSLGLAIHELATNASKYGALSNDVGSIDVTWTFTDEGRVTVTWIESGGPQVQSPQRRGFGLDLLETIVAVELGEKVTVEFEPNGVRCTIQLNAATLPKNKQQQIFNSAR